MDESSASNIEALDKCAKDYLATCVKSCLYFMNTSSIWYNRIFCTCINIKSSDACCIMRSPHHRLFSHLSSEVKEKLMNIVNILASHSWSKVACHDTRRWRRMVNSIVITKCNVICNVFVYQNSHGDCWTCLINDCTNYHHLITSSRVWTINQISNFKMYLYTIVPLHYDF